MKKTTKKQAEAARDSAMESVEKNAEMSFEQFTALAMEEMVRHIEKRGRASGEDLTDHCLSKGIIPHDERAFGPVIAKLAKRGIIHRVGFCPRNKGHLTAGGSIWALVERGAE